MRWGRRFVAANLVGALAWSLRGPKLTPDSLGYLHHAGYRPPLVPVVFTLFGVFGGWQLPAIVVAQLLVGVLAALTLARALVAFVDGAAWLCAPLFYVLFVPQLNHGLWIMSDSLSYSLFLVAVAAGLRALRAPDGPALVRLVAWSAAAWLARAQLSFLLPLVAGALIAFVWPAPRARWRAAAGGAAILALAQLASPLYNRAFNGAFVSLRAAGIHLLAVVTFVSRPDDLAALDGDERAFEASVLAQAHARGLLLDDIPRYQPEAHHFYASFDAIAWETIARRYCADLLHRPLGENALVSENLSPREWQAFDRFTTSIALHLLRRSVGRYLVHIVTVAYQLYRAFLFVVFAMLAVGVAWWRRPAGQLLALAAALWLANLALVSLVQVPFQRYTFPTDALATAVLVMMLVEAARGARRA